MIRDRCFDAVLLDLDGTLLDDHGEVRPRTRLALQALESAGAHVMIATGRSNVASLPIHLSLGLQTPMVVFNGAAIHCPREGRLIEERILSNRVVPRALEHGREQGYLMVVQLAEEKYSTVPRNAEEERALRFFTGLQLVDASELPTEYVIRVVYFSDRHSDSRMLRDELQVVAGDPVFLTDFPLNILVGHRASNFQVVDVHPPCRGKAEGLRYLNETHGIPLERMVAIGDASNDIAMLKAAGLGVAMEHSCERTRKAADRVIGGNNTDAIADLLVELFGITL